MLQKNQKKLESKKRRGIWSCARPVTQVVPNRKKQTRQQNKQELRRRIREDSNPSYFYTNLWNDLQYMVDIASSTSDHTNAKFTDQEKWCFACNAYRALHPEIGIIVYTFDKGKLYGNSNFKGDQRQIYVSHSPIITKIEIA